MNQKNKSENISIQSAVKPALLIMAAGMGSRYGALKQLDGIGPNNETILDYSIFDAMRAGFGKVVFIIRKSFEKEFNEHVVNRLQTNGIDCHYVFQELNKLPEGFKLPESREKPWGTAHAVLMAKDIINEPFAAINADDFYGKDAYNTIYQYLSKVNINSNDYAMVGYDILSTLSESGTVSRGVCEVDENNFLSSIQERLKISLINGQLVDIENGKEVILTGKEKVSMNFWGFTPTFFNHVEDCLIDFLKENIDNPKSELYIPTVVFKLIKDGISKVKVLSSNASWFGITYKEDRKDVIDNIRKLISKGEYPEKLWK
ncbi:MAG: nucleotidyltransferase [Bacteroidales bacterium]|jgi:dTDP-glucose pyrophosphorylase|nr:nucleotidyltransferase [Bacteroidales bacterium]